MRLIAREPVTPSRDAIDAWARMLLAMPDVKEWMCDARQLPPVWLDDYMVPGQPVDVNVVADPSTAP